MPLFPLWLNEDAGTRNNIATTAVVSMYALDVNFIASVSEIIIVSTVPDSGATHLQ
jgi:hypothetical protein